MQLGTVFQNSEGKKKKKTKKRGKNKTKKKKELTPNVLCELNYN